jgi:excisionase family DNA binding protein
MTTADRIAELEQYIEDIKFKLSISPDHPIRSQLPGAEAELAELVARYNHPTNQSIGDNDHSETATTGTTGTSGTTNVTISGTTDVTISGNTLVTISVTEAAARLNVTPQTIRNWVRAGRLTHVTYGKSFRIVPSELFALQAMRRETRVVDAPEQRGA